jgi:hypothetical protein
MLADVSGDEVEAYLLKAGVVQPTAASADQPGLRRCLCMNGGKAAIPPPGCLRKMAQIGTLSPVEGHMTIDFKNLIVGRHESSLKSYSYGTLEKVSPCLGHFEESKTESRAILARDGITPEQRAILKEFRAIAAKNNWDFATLRELNRPHTMGGCG